jgi:hypothetical protein
MGYLNSYKKRRMEKMKKVTSFYLLALIASSLLSQTTLGTNNITQPPFDLFNVEKSNIGSLLEKIKDIPLTGALSLQTTSTTINIIQSPSDPFSMGKLYPEPLWEVIKNIPSPAEKPMVIIIASYNNKDWYKLNLDSVFRQNYTNYRIIYIDDASTDKTGDLVEKHIKEKHQENRVTLIKNKKNLKALANIYSAIHEFSKDNEIVVVIDGDDWLAHDHVFALLNKVYQDPNVWMTYGQFLWCPEGDLGFCSPFPQNIIDSRDFRNYTWVSSHLRTFYSGLFKKIKFEDLTDKDGFFPVTCDLAIMFPMLEMASPRICFIPDVLYVYNRMTPLNDDKVRFDRQIHYTNICRNKPKYSALAKI